jgi:sodium/bile acid cotransporter 7
MIHSHGQQPAAAAYALNERPVLPLMIFHQLQLMACATLAQRYAARDTPPSATAVSWSEIHSN